MTRSRKAIAAVAGIVLAGLALTGCAALRELVAEVPLDVPSPTLPTAAEPREKIYQGGSRPDDVSDEEWATKSQRRITAMGALHGVPIYAVDAEENSDGLIVRVKGDPGDAELLTNLETYVVPVALSWAPTVTVIIDPSLCGIVGEVRDESPICDKLTDG